MQTHLWPHPEQLIKNIIMFSFLERKQNLNLFRGKVSAMLIQLHNQTVTVSGLMCPKAWRELSEWTSHDPENKFAIGQYSITDPFRVFPDVLRGSIWFRDHFFQSTDICLSDVPHVDTNRVKAMNECQGYSQFEANRGTCVKHCFGFCWFIFEEG